MSAHHPTPRQKAWRDGERLREIGREALGKWNRERKDAPRCGARTKRTGELCQGFALENGRCRVHGGPTPAGDDWHKPRFCAAVASSERFEKKLQRKLAALEKRRKKIAERVAAMTPERRERYERWHRTHKPTSQAARAAARRDAQQAAECRAMLATDDDRQAARPSRINHRAFNPAVGGHSGSEREKTMAKPKTTPAEIAGAMRQKMQAEGVAIAYQALKAVAADENAPAQARATAATSIMRAAGMFDKAATPDERPFEERSAAEILMNVERQFAEMRDDAHEQHEDHADIDDEPRWPTDGVMG